MPQRMKGENSKGNQLRVRDSYATLTLRICALSLPLFMLFQGSFQMLRGAAVNGARTKRAKT